MNNSYFRFPYYYANNLKNAAGASSLATLPNLIKKFSFSKFLNGAERTLGVINQAIPVVSQIKPIWSNAKTMFKMFKYMNTDNNNNKSTNNSEKSNEKSTIEDKPIKDIKDKKNSNQPVFFK